MFVLQLCGSAPHSLTLSKGMHLRIVRHSRARRRQLMQIAHPDEPIEIDEDALPFVTEEEVAEHNTPEDLWIIVHGKVYDVTEWQHSHPGGDWILQEYGGKDASAMFRSVQHSQDALALRPNFMIAKLEPKAKL